MVETAVLGLLPVPPALGAAGPLWLRQHSFDPTRAARCDVYVASVVVGDPFPHWFKIRRWRIRVMPSVGEQEHHRDLDLQPHTREFFLCAWQIERREHHDTTDH